MSRRFAVGIDLGTSNTALAAAQVDAQRGTAGPIAPVEIPQLTALGVVEARPLLPSFLYLPGPAELSPPAGASAPSPLDLPWEANPGFAVGAFARDRGAKVPHRLVSSAKSWLCNDRVDRMAPILPPATPGQPANKGPTERQDDAADGAALPRVSPLAATARLLAHLRDAWAFTHPGDALPLSQQEVVLTVPASFDLAARDLTLMAARAAGVEHLTLLEEPQAALYAWLDQHRADWRGQVTVGDLVLVCDVGGGTTDFSLIAITEDPDAPGQLALERVAVGEHLLLGGDNMDYALAYAVKRQLEADPERPTRLDAWQLRALVQGVRATKEDLLADDAPASRAVSVPTRGARLVAGARRVELTRQAVSQLVQRGFFPDCAVTDTPRAGRRAGLSQIALDYASDPAITRHLATFLRRARLLTARRADLGEAAATATFAHPTAVLFNGGVMRAPALRQRVVDVLNGWLAADGAPPVAVLQGADLDLAVARGAAAYAALRATGQGVRIRSGTAHAYYVGVEQPMPAIPGFAPPTLAVCVAPLGLEEGHTARLDDEPFALALGQPARFRFFASSTRRDDPVGLALDSELALASGELVELPEVETTLHAAAQPGDDARGHAAPHALPDIAHVHIEATATATGTLALHLVESDTSGPTPAGQKPSGRTNEGRQDPQRQASRWKLEFDVRQAHGDGTP